MGDELNFYKEYPKTVAEDDYWRQVCRTINGQPAPEEQIQLIVEQISSCLELCPTDRLLDLCCGNGALTHRLWQGCHGGLGVDFSEYLVSVARKHFLPITGGSNYGFICSDVIEFCEAQCQAHHNKALCYGSLQYFPKDRMDRFMRAIRTHDCNIEKLFIGNVPDVGVAEEYFQLRGGAPCITDDPSSPVGCWWSPAELLKIAEDYGWSGSVLRMPAKSYWSGQRFDLLLTPSARDC